MNTDKVLPISVIIPTYCEEEWLPILLHSLREQVLQPFEIIVADAQSTDKTREIAREYGAKVVEGGKIAVGRNNGAKVAKGDYLLFMDADTFLPNNLFLLQAFIKFVKEELDIASVRFLPSKKHASVKSYLLGNVMFRSWNVVKHIQSLSGKIYIEGGAFILVRKKVFRHIGGFRKDVPVGEDRDFFRDATILGYAYKMLPFYIKTSVRRYQSVKSTAKYLLAFSILGVIAGRISRVNGLKEYEKLKKKMFATYGRLGGGEGKDPTD